MEKDFIKICVKKWRWFAGSVVAMVLIAIMFLLMVAPKYERTASILIKDENSGGMLSSMAANMGMLAGISGLNIASTWAQDIKPTTD